jgi:hypothetical protein
MELETVRANADWLNGVTTAQYSVNQLLAGVPRDGGDPVPPNVTVRDSTRHGWVARRTLPREGEALVFPVLAVMVLSDFELDGEILTTYRDGNPQVLIAYLHREVDTEKAIAAGGYTLRAVQRSFAKFNHPDHVGARTRNGIVLRVCTALREVPVGLLRQLAVDLPITAALVATYAVRDTQPYPA